MDIKTRPKDRQPSSNISGSPKKGGAGGKGTWGVGGLDDLKAVKVADSRDPNYDSEEDVAEVVIAKTDISSPSEVLVQEYLASGDIDETIKSLKELKISHIHGQFVKKALFTAMDKQAYEREIVSKLLLSIYEVAVTPEHIAEGFQLALDSLDDIVLDTPDAVDVLSKFLARAIIDEIVAPAFLKTAIAKSPRAEECLGLANAQTNQPFRSERLAHIWGAGDLSSVKRLKEESALVIEEFLTNGDLKEAYQSVRDLNAHYFHPQLVKLALRLSLTKDEVQQKKILSLLASFCESGVISKDHVREGFNQCCKSLPDLKLDVLNAPIVLVGFIKTAKTEGWLDSSFEEPKTE